MDGKMKIAKFIIGEQERFGEVQGDRICEIRGDIFSGDFEVTQTEYPLDKVTLAPVTNPTKVIGLAVNYSDHAAEHNTTTPEEPWFFLKPPSALIGHKEAIILPPNAKQVEYEAELVFVIKDKIKNIPIEKAFDHILGYTCGNDVSARDIQEKDRTWPNRAKGFDTFAPVGPYIVTDIDPGNLKIELFQNGELRQSSNTSYLVFDVPTLVSFISREMTLFPGDLIYTGTPSGVGPINDGDVIEVKIENIGTLTNFGKRT